MANKYAIALVASSASLLKLKFVARNLKSGEELLVEVDRLPLATTFRVNGAMPKGDQFQLINDMLVVYDNTFSGAFQLEV